MNKYYVRITKDNKDKLTKFLKDHSSEYESYSNNWKHSEGYWFEYPQVRSGSYCCSFVRGDIELTCEQLLALILKSPKYIIYL